ncbi:hypothetical protein RN001_005419 [Aquatica leii]|uniref:Transmembrane protein 216 n=1 Tax=Aquatica leii TaxID=1421715 RepID=A0AAN7P6J3_9COLE|nr:hypothetical protein RN001_005419 [Aquatica leii]
MNIVKAINLSLPNFETDFGILLAVCVLELFRVILARRGNFTEKAWPVILAISLTLPSAVGVVYFVFWQSVVLRLEYIICGIQFVFQIAEIIFGILCLLPVCKNQEY